MSWIFGVIPKYDKSCGNIKLPLDDDIQYSHKTDKIQIYAGGTDNNFHAQLKNKTGWIVCGTGLRNEDGATHILSTDNWEHIFSKKDSEVIINSLDGHFTIVTWTSNSVNFYTDVLGLRDIYIAENESGIFFSTKIKWLAKCLKLEINFFEFGSRWSLYNQVSTNSIFKNVKRVVAGKKATISLNSNPAVEFHDYNWLPENVNDFGLSEFSTKLGSLINLKFSGQNKLSLSLSGGMDSRVILSFLLKNQFTPFYTHTFGNPNHPDSLLANKIANHFSIRHKQIDSEIPPIEKTVQEISDYSTQTIVNNSASTFLQFHNYYKLSEDNLIVVDGGFGEIWRGEFFYKLFLLGQGNLLSGNIQNIIPQLKVHRGDIFISDINEEMNSGIHFQLEELINKLPDINKIGIRNWLDIFAVKTRLSNYYSPEQTWLDDKLTTIMPFAQRSILNGLFQMPLQLRSNGLLFNNLIKMNAPGLTKFGLVKGQSVQPYFLNSFQSRVWNFIQNILPGRNYNNSTLHVFLFSLKAFVLDTLNSQSVKECPFYDYPKVKKMIEFYYGGNNKYANALDWWLSFELFRKSINS